MIFQASGFKAAGSKFGESPGGVFLGGHRADIQAAHARDIRPLSLSSCA